MVCYDCGGLVDRLVSDGLLRACLLWVLRLVGLLVDFWCCLQVRFGVVCCFWGLLVALAGGGFCFGYFGMCGLVYCGFGRFAALFGLFGLILV